MGTAQSFLKVNLFILLGKILFTRCVNPSCFRV